MRLGHFCQFASLVRTVGVGVFSILLFVGPAHGQARNDSEKADKSEPQDAPPVIPQAGATLQDFVPPGYLIFEEIQIDLRHTGQRDIAAVLSAGEDSMEPRPLIVLTARRGGGYTLLTRSDTLAPGLAEMGIANANGGGVLRREGKDLVVTRYGGAAPTTYSTHYVFRFEKGDLYLIKKLYEDVAPMGSCQGDPPETGDDGCYLERHKIVLDTRLGKRVESWKRYAAQGPNVGRPIKRKIVRSYVPKTPLVRFADLQPGDPGGDEMGPSAGSASALVPSLADKKISSPVGYYESNPGHAGEKNRLCISSGPSNTYQVEISTVYCATAFSPDCANARFGGAYFSAQLKYGKLDFYKTETGCRISIDFKRASAFVTQSIGKCEEQFPYDDASGEYFRKKDTVEENSCSP